jgi:translation initiation factor 3 subunit M
LAYVRGLPSSSSKLEPATLQAIATALQIPSILDFDELLKLPSIANVKNTPLFALLKIFVSGTLTDYQSWANGNAGALEQFSGYYLPFALCFML